MIASKYKARFNFNFHLHFIRSTCCWLVRGFFLATHIRKQFDHEFDFECKSPKSEETGNEKQETKTERKRNVK